jgi:glycerol-3-phosphate acyltransferase PlsX
MGSDTPPQFLYEAVVKAALQFGNSYTFIVLATPLIQEEMRSTITGLENIRFHTASDEITMNDEPLTAIRRKKGASLVVGVKLLKKKLLDALVSCGNTGALVAASALTLTKLPHIKRPALLAVLPAETPLAVIDVGGNVSCKAHHLVQFAAMGSAYQRSLLALEAPRVGLLNIGVEFKKGTRELRQAYQHLQAHEKELKIKFLGNIEAREVFQGKVDVLVTDGFTGNVLLKSIEGASTFILESLAKNSDSKFQEVLKEEQKRFHYAEYPGAIICGIDKIVIKCHGNATANALFNSIKGAVKMGEVQLIEKMKRELDSLTMAQPTN